MSIFAKILMILGMRKHVSIGEIIAPINKIVRDLEAYSKEQSDRAIADFEQAEKIREKADKEVACASEAQALCQKYKQLTGASFSAE